MPTDDIDDLFRSQLDGHPTPPGEALWARLQAATPPPTAAEAQAERLDALFRTALAQHSTPPARALWERLEDEHLRPRKRRPAAWWPVALAAALALLLAAGGAGLWLSSPFGRYHGEPVAQQRAENVRVATSLSDRLHPSSPASPITAKLAASAGSLAADVGSKPQPSSVLAGKNKLPRATPSPTLASTASKANAAAPGLRPKQQTGPARLLDAAAAPTRLVANRPGLPTATDERQSAPVVVKALLPAAEIVPAPATPAPVLATAGELITVDVRNGAAPALRPARAMTAAVAAAAEAPEGRRRLGGRLLQQAGHLVRGERVSLAEVTGLPESLTLHATVGGRCLTKSIQL